VPSRLLGAHPFAGAEAAATRSAIHRGAATHHTPPKIPSVGAEAAAARSCNTPGVTLARATLTLEAIFTKVKT
jgi:hypothetical protein